jgi:hypothetical protein
MSRALEIKYIGAVALLGRLSPQIRDDDDRYCIKQAMDDLLAEMPGRFEIWKVSGGFSLEPKRD